MVLRQPIVHIQNFLRIGGRRRDLRQQGIGIESHRSQQLIQLLRRRHRRSLRLQVGSQSLKNNQNHQKKNCGQTGFTLHAFTPRPYYCNVFAQGS
jgi:hypothetical protein